MGQKSIQSSKPIWPSKPTHAQQHRARHAVRHALLHRVPPAVAQRMSRTRCVDQRTGKQVAVHCATLAARLKIEERSGLRGRRARLGVAGCTVCMHAKAARQGSSALARGADCVGAASRSAWVRLGCRVARGAGCGRRQRRSQRKAKPGSGRGVFDK